MAEMSRAFAEAMGDDAAGMYETLKGAAALIALQTHFTLADEDSHDEAVAAEYLESAVIALMAQPEKAADVMGALLAVIVHMRTGHAFLDFFKRAGVEVITITNTETGAEA